MLLVHSCYCFNGSRCDRKLHFYFNDEKNVKKIQMISNTPEKSLI